jgi:hypothetical protein
MRASPGTRLGPYEIVKALGAGGMGEVYEARDTRLDRPVAIKVLPAELAADATARARFDREARAIAALNHPNICALHDIGDADGRGYLVMERLEGETLQERLQRGPLDLAQAIDDGIALADALDAAHARGLIHRDLKPANIFITTRGIVKILDFGLAKSVQESNVDITRSVNDALTTTGTTLGTVAYMSPEQLRGEPLDVRTDLFSFGLVLYEMATGARAFGGSTIVVAAAGILNQQPPAPRTIRAELPESLERVILKALEKDLARRYQSANELRADLTNVKRGGVPAFAPAVPASAAAAQPVAQPRRSRFRSLVFALCLTAIAIVLIDSFKPDRPAVQQTAASVPAQPTIQPPQGSTPPEAAQPPAQSPAGAVPEVKAAPSPPPAPPPLVLTTPSGVTAEAPASAAAAPPAVEPPFGGRASRARGGRAFGPGSPALIKMLQNVPPETYDLVYAANDAEAMSMAQQIRGALEKAGWTNASMMEIAQPTAKLGIFAPRPTAGITTLTNWATRQGLKPDVRRVANLPRLRIVIGKQE